MTTKLFAKARQALFRVSTQTRLACSASLLALLVGALVGGTNSLVQSSVLLEEIQRKAAGVAASAAANFDGNSFDRLATTRDRTSVPYWSLKTYLKASESSNPDILRIYTVVPTPELNSWMVVVDAEDSPSLALPIGAAYDISTKPMVRAALAHATASETVANGPTGHFVSGYAPIRDHDGAPVGVVVVDILADSFIENDARLKDALVKSLAVAAVLAAFLGVQVARHFSKPVQLLAEATRQVSSGDLNIEVPLHRGDEFGELANGFNQMIRRLRESQDALTRLANTDALTGLPNHRHAQETLTREIRLARRYIRPLGVMMIDIDNFKLFNDSYGHLHGDEVIRLVANTLSSMVRDTDWVARYAGDEFLVILPESDSAGVAGIAQRIIAGLRTQSFRDPAGLRIPVSCSIGSAIFPSDAQTESELIDLADLAMYEIKRGGGNGHQASSYEASEKLKAGSSTLGVLDGLVAAVDGKDHYTREHSEAVTKLSMVIAQRLGMPSDVRNTVRIAGLLHDVGKIGIPNSILHKPAKLDDDEYAVMKQHPLLGAMII